jgi:hypothetical protein
MAVIFRASEGDDMHMGVSCRTLRVSDYLENVGVVGRIILKWI